MSTFDSIYVYLYPSFVDIEKVLDAQKRGELPRMEDLRVALTFALALGVLRYTLSQAVFAPIGKYGMKIHDMKKPASNMLTDEYTRAPCASKSQMEEIAKKKQVSVAEVTEYFRSQRKYNKQLKQISKFNEASWRFLIYAIATVAGIVTTWNKPWLWDFSLCWVDYPHQQQLDNSHYWLYMLELGINFHLLSHHFFEIKRSDFWEMFIHHIATIGLIGYSYLINFVRVGTIIMVVHDPSDIFLEVAKCFNYIKSQRPWAKYVCDGLFVVFAIVFFVLRLIIFPFLIKSTLVDAYYLFGAYVPWFIFNFLLFVLLFLHIFWFYLISKMIFRAILSGEVEKDIRSDDDEADDDSSESNTKTKESKTKPKKE